MADEASMAVLELLRKHGCEADVDVLREGMRLLSQRLMELEVSEQLGAGRYERTPDGWATQGDARAAVFAWIAVYDNRQRHHGSIGYRTPVEFERSKGISKVRSGYLATKAG